MFASGTPLLGSSLARRATSCPTLTPTSRPSPSNPFHLLAAASSSNTLGLPLEFALPQPPPRPSQQPCLPASIATLPPSFPPQHLDATKTRETEAADQAEAEKAEVALAVAEAYEAKQRTRKARWKAEAAEDRLAPLLAAADAAEAVFKVKVAALEAEGEAVVAAARDSAETARGAADAAALAFAEMDAKAAAAEVDSAATNARLAGAKAAVARNLTRRASSRARFSKLAAEEAAEAAEVSAWAEVEVAKVEKVAEASRELAERAFHHLAELAQRLGDEKMVKEAARAAAAEAQARVDAEERERLAAEERDKARRRANGEYVRWVQGEYCAPFTVQLEVREEEEGGEASIFARLLDVEAVEALGKARVRILPQLEGGEASVSLFLFDPFSGDKLGRAPAWLEELERPLMPMEAARIAKAASRLAAAYKGKIARSKGGRQLAKEAGVRRAQHPPTKTRTSKLTPTEEAAQAEEERQGELERRKSRGRISEFKGKEAKRKMLLRGFDVDEDSDKSVAEQLRDALSKSAVRVVDLFKDWDTDGNGKVSKEEFHKAMGILGFSAPAEDIDALFDSWDPDGSGLLSMGELDKQLSEHKAQLEAQRKARALKRTQTTSVKRLEDGEIDEAAARIAAVRNAQAERRERAAAAAKRRSSKEASDAALAAEMVALERAAMEAAEATRWKWWIGLKFERGLSRRKLASERRMLAAAAAEAAAKLEGAAAEAEPQPAQLGELEFEAAHSYVVKGHGWQWSAELGCWPAPAGPPLWTAAQAEVYTGQANATVWKPKIATTASLFHDVSTAQLPPSHSPTAPRVPVPPAALTPTKEASPRARRRGVNAVYLKQVRAHSSPKLALNHL